MCFWTFCYAYYKASLGELHWLLGGAWEARWLLFQDLFLSPQKKRQGIGDFIRSDAGVSPDQKQGDTFPVSVVHTQSSKAWPQGEGGGGTYEEGVWAENHMPLINGIRESRTSVQSSCELLGLNF